MIIRRGRRTFEPQQLALGGLHCGTLTVSHGAEPHVLAVGGITKVEVLGLVPAAEADSIGPSRNRHGFERLV